MAKSCNSGFAVVYYENYYYEVMSAEKCLRIYLNPSFEADFVLLPFLTMFNSTTLCTDMGFYICDVCCVNGKVLVGESGFMKQHAVYPVQPVADRHGMMPL